MLFTEIKTIKMKTFLNRILGMEVTMQNALFEYFSSTMQHFIAVAKREGRLESGIFGKFDLFQVNNQLDIVKY